MIEELWLFSQKIDFFFLYKSLVINKLSSKFIFNRLSDFRKRLVFIGLILKKKLLSELAALFKIINWLVGTIFFKKKIISDLINLVLKECPKINSIFEELINLDEKIQCLALKTDKKVFTFKVIKFVKKFVELQNPEEYTVNSFFKYSILIFIFKTTFSSFKFEENKKQTLNAFVFKDCNLENKLLL